MLTIIAGVIFTCMSFWHLIIVAGVVTYIFDPKGKMPTGLRVTQKDVIIFGGAFVAWMASGVYLFGVW